MGRYPHGLDGYMGFSTIIFRVAFRLSVHITDLAYRSTPYEARASKLLGRRQYKCFWSVICERRRIQPTPHRLNILEHARPRYTEVIGRAAQGSWRRQAPKTCMILVSFEVHNIYCLLFLEAKSSKRAMVRSSALPPGLLLPRPKPFQNFSDARTPGVCGDDP